MRSTRQPLPHHTRPAARGRVARLRHAASRQSLLPLLLMVVATSALSTPAPAAAQQTASAGVVAGTVRGAGAVLVDAHVTIAGSQLGSVTGPNGQFLIAGVPAGRSVLEIRLIGYRPVSRPIIVVPGDSLVLVLEMEVDPVRLDALEGRAVAGLSAELRGFYERRERGTGHYFTREDITRMHARLVTDVVRRVPGVRVEPLAGPMGTSYVIRMQRATGMSGARPCPVVYFVNGVPFSIAAEIGINSYFRADEIAAMEVYSGASQLPPQFSLSSRNTRCGVIALWTYAGERRQNR
jgi:hypothetical protein